MHVLSISLYYNDEYAAINYVIFGVLQWCYSDVSNVIKSNNFFNNGPIRVSFAHIVQHCFFVCLTLNTKIKNGGEKKCCRAFLNRHKS